MKLEIDAPTSDAQRDRIERATFEQLARTRGHVEAPPAGARWMLPALALAAAVIAIVVVVRSGGAPGPAIAQAPSRVVTPVAGGSRFTVGDAVIDAGSDTSVEVTQSDDGAIALVLARGSVDCDVMPRKGRPPFRVLAGEVAVEVVGTRFTVTRAGALVRVDVARGKVRVSTPDSERFVEAGETWSSETRTAVLAPPPPPPPTPPRADPKPPVAPPATRSAHDAFAAAQRLESTDSAGAARGYRKVANGSDSWAALALYSLAELDVARGHRTAALAEIDEYEWRFRTGANAEDAAWSRVDVLRSSGDASALRAAATNYLDRFHSGTYATTARRLVDSTR